jgi:hypothetical protein
MLAVNMYIACGDHSAAFSSSGSYLVEYQELILAN